MFKVIRRISGHLVMRPAQNHPHPSRWEELRVIARDRQRGADGQVHCGTCWRIESDFGFDLHHRHYNNFGNEDPDDLILLCRQCHEAITARIRSERYALGDRSDELVAELLTETKEGERYRPKPRTIVIEDETEQKTEVRVRPTFKRDPFSY
jgi:hypothetical protein